MTTPREKVAREGFKLLHGPDIEWGHRGTIDDESWRRVERRCLEFAGAVLGITGHPPSCWDCKKASIYGGFGGTYEIPPEPAACECAYATEEQMENYGDDERALTCAGFDPHPTGPCGECKKEIEHPRFSWLIIVMGMYVNFPCCSMECQEKAKAKVEAEVQREIEEHR